MCPCLWHSLLQGIMGTFGKFTRFLLAHLCQLPAERLWTCSHIGLQAHVFVNRTFPFPLKPDEFTALNQASTQSRETMREPHQNYCCSKSAAGVDKSYCFPRINFYISEKRQWICMLRLHTEHTSCLKPPTMMINQPHFSKFPSSLQIYLFSASNSWILFGCYS